MQVIDDTISDVRARFGLHGLERVEECLAILAGRGTAEPGHPEQEATRLFFPGLRAQPWFDTAEFEWTRDVEARWADVRDELLRLQGQGTPFAPYEDRYTGDLGWKGWETRHLYRSGEFTPGAQEACPTACWVLERSGRGLREGMFSRLEPGAHLSPHTGGVNLVLTVHLPLVVPPDCALTVADEAREWRPGQLMIFDDSFIHEAWNRSLEPRTVLLWDVWHPDLSPREREVLAFLFPRLEALLKTL